MTPEEIGRRIVDAVKAHSLSAEARGGQIKARVMAQGRCVFGPASVAECDAWIYDMIGQLALAATTKH